MRNGFSIIGLSGSLGSGCSEVAKFLSVGLADYAKELKREQQKVKRNIKDHFEFIKKEADKYSAVAKERKSKVQDPEISLDEVFRDISTEVTAKQFEERLKVVNRRLRDLLIRRKVLSYFVKNNWSSYCYISMSTMIVKLMLLKAIKKNNVKTTEFVTYCTDNKVQARLRDFIVRQAKLLRPNIIKFDEACLNKSWKAEDYIVFDELLISLEAVKNEMYDKYNPCKAFFQDMGDNIRSTGNPYAMPEATGYDHLKTLAREANMVIKFQRNRVDAKKNHFVIDSFRNPTEVRFFRKRYGSFYLCSLFAPKDYRQERMGARFDETADSRDAGKNKDSHELHKQDVTSCTLLADYALNTDKGSGYYRFEIARLLTLIDRPGLVPPRTDEVFMNFAYGLSLRSTCISRQVGAVITNVEGFVIASGWNDVGSGQLGCSLVCIDDYKKFADDDHSISNWGPLIEGYDENKLFSSYRGDDYFCFKDLQSKSLLQSKINNILRKQKNANCLSSCSAINSVKKNLSVKRLEYARSLHAEENAILQAARFGGSGIAGGTIYTTTFPCELCSKKIYQAQLNRIVYTEPYPDSLSETIFLKDGVRQIAIEQFEGVKSPSFHRLFKSAVDLKEYQTIDDFGDEID